MTKAKYVKLTKFQIYAITTLATEACARDGRLELTKLSVRMDGKLLRNTREVLQMRGVLAAKKVKR